MIYTCIVYYYIEPKYLQAGGESGVGASASMQSPFPLVSTPMCMNPRMVNETERSCTLSEIPGSVAYATSLAAFINTTAAREQTHSDQCYW